MRRQILALLLILPGCTEPTPPLAQHRSAALEFGELPGPDDPNGDQPQSTDPVEVDYREADPDAPEPVPDPPEAPRVEAQPVEHDFEALRAEYLATSPTFAAAMANMKVGVAPPDLLPLPEPVVEDAHRLSCEKPVPPPSPAALARAGGYVEGRLDVDVAWTERLAATPASDLVSPSVSRDEAASDDTTPPNAAPKPDEEAEP